MDKSRTLAGQQIEPSAHLVGVTRLLVLQGTPFCNIDCTYCYLPDRRSTRRMSLEVVSAAIDWIYESRLAANPLEVLWHAGEPLTIPLAWYRSAIDLADARKPSGARIIYSLQSNGMLLDQAWCSFFKEKAINLGISLDGPEWLHDAHRKTRAGRGTYRRVVDAVAGLQSHNVPFKVICVISRESLRAPEEIIDFFGELGVKILCLNIEEREGANETSSMDFPGARAQVSEFFDRALKRAHRYPWLIIRERDSLVSWLHHEEFGLVHGNEQNLPLRILTVADDGSLYTFSPELAGMKHPTLGKLSIGNVLSCSVTDIIQSPRYLAMAAEVKAGVDACSRSCRYFRLCRGGAPANKVAEHGTFNATETLHCALSEQTVADAVLRGLEMSLSSTPETLL